MLCFVVINSVLLNCSGIYKIFKFGGLELTQETGSMASLQNTVKKTFTLDVVNHSVSATIQPIITCFRVPSSSALCAVTVASQCLARRVDSPLTCSCLSCKRPCSKTGEPDADNM